MKMTLEERKRALSHLGIQWVSVGGSLEIVQGDEPTEKQLADSYAAWTSSTPEEDWPDRS